MKQKRKVKSLISSTGESNLFLTGLLFLLGGILVFGAVTLFTSSVGVEAATPDDKIEYEGLYDEKEVLLRFGLIPYGGTTPVNEMYLTGKTFIISGDNGISVDISNNNALDKYINYLGGEGGMNVNSNNITIIGGYADKVYTNNDNAAILGGNENTIDNGNNKVAPVMLGGQNDKIGTNQEGNVIVGGKDNEIKNERSYDVILGGNNNVVDGNNVIVGGTRVKVNGKSDLFAFSYDSSNDFSPKGSKAFYLNLKKGLGLNKKVENDGVDSNGAVSFGEININSQTCTTADAGVQGTWQGCLVGCTTSSASNRSDWKWEMIDHGTGCEALCDTSTHCMISPVADVTSTYTSYCTTGGVDTGHSHHCGGEANVLPTYQNILFETKLIDSDDPCPDPKSPNRCVFKCDGGYHLTGADANGNGGKCYKDCVLPWDSTTIKHNEERTAYKRADVNCSNDLDSQKGPYTCNNYKATLRCDNGTLIVKNAYVSSDNGKTASNGGYVYSGCMLHQYRCPSTYNYSYSDIVSSSKFNDTVTSRGTTNRGYTYGTRGQYKLCIDYDAQTENTVEYLNGDNCFARNYISTSPKHYTLHYQWLGCRSGYHTGAGYENVCMKDCTLDGKTIRHNQTMTGYRVKSPTCPTNCEVGEVFTCNDGHLVSGKPGVNTGTYQYSSCKPTGVNCEGYGISQTIYNGHYTTSVYESCQKYSVNTSNLCTTGDKVYKLTNCADGYHTEDGKYNGTNVNYQYCVGNSKSVNCSKSGAPSNAYYNVVPVTVTWKSSCGWKGTTASCWNNPTNCSWDCNCGYYKDGNSCTACAVGKYSAAGSSSCSSCSNKPSNSYYTSNACTNSCGWACNASYYKNGSSCPACAVGKYSTAGSTSCSNCTNKPSNSHYTSNGTSATSCSWECDDGFTRSGNSCIALSCDGDVPGNNTRASSTNPSSSGMSWEYVENTSATLSACQWTCEDSTYERDGTTMNCKKKTNQSCSAKTYTYENCSYSILAKNHGQSQTVSTSTNGYNGSVTATCNNGERSYSSPSCTKISRTYYITPKAVTENGATWKIDFEVMADDRYTNLENNVPIYIAWTDGFGHYSDDFRIPNGKSSSSDGVYEGFGAYTIGNAGSFDIEDIGFDNGYRKQTTIDGDTYVMNRNYVPGDPQCGSAMGPLSLEKPASDTLCSAGTATDPVEAIVGEPGSLGWSWECEERGATEYCWTYMPTAEIGCESIHNDGSAPQVFITPSYTVAGAWVNLRLQGRCSNGSRYNVTDTFQVYSTTSIGIVLLNGAYCGDTPASIERVDVIGFESQNYNGYRLVEGASCSNNAAPACGTANGTTRNSAPATYAEKCSVGTPSIVYGGDDGSGWGWDCEQNGSTAHCTAREYPKCGSASGATVSELPSGTEACDPGYRLTGGGLVGSQYQWRCGNGTGQVDCSADAKANVKFVINNNGSIPIYVAEVEIGERGQSERTSSYGCVPENNTSELSVQVGQGNSLTINCSGEDFVVGKNYYPQLVYDTNQGANPSSTQQYDGYSITPGVGDNTYIFNVSEQARCLEPSPGDNTIQSSATPATNKSWTYKEGYSLSQLGACEWACEDSTYERDGTTMNCKKKTNQSCSETTIDDYSVPPLTHGQTKSITQTKSSGGCTLSCTATFSCSNTNVTKVSESCSCSDGCTISPSNGATLHNGSCAIQPSCNIECGTEHYATCYTDDGTFYSNGQNQMSPSDGAGDAGNGAIKYTWRCDKPSRCTTTNPATPLLCSCTTKSCNDYSSYGYHASQYDGGSYQVWPIAVNLPSGCYEEDEDKKYIGCYRSEAYLNVDISDVSVGYGEDINGSNGACGCGFRIKGGGDSSHRGGIVENKSYVTLDICVSGESTYGLNACKYPESAGCTTSITNIQGNFGEKVGTNQWNFKSSPYEDDHIVTVNLGSPEDCNSCTPKTCRDFGWDSYSAGYCVNTRSFSDDCGGTLTCYKNGCTANGFDQHACVSVSELSTACANDGGFSDVQEMQDGYRCIACKGAACEQGQVEVSLAEVQHYQDDLGASCSCEGSFCCCDGTINRAINVFFSTTPCDGAYIMDFVGSDGKTYSVRPDGCDDSIVETNCRFTINNLPLLNMTSGNLRRKRMSNINGGWIECEDHGGTNLKYFDFNDYSYSEPDIDI